MMKRDLFCIIEGLGGAPMNQTDSPITSLLFQNVDLSDESDVGKAIQAAILLYFIILALSIVTYKLGFAKKLPVLKSAVIYVVLALGCTMLTVLAIFGLPIAEGLIVSSLILGIYRYRLHNERKGKDQEA